MSASRTRVLYIGGTGRSGSTLLANLLGELPGAVSVGEVRFLWERGILQNRLCGCGWHVADCPFWSEVLDLALGDRDRQQLARWAADDLVGRTRIRGLPRLVGPFRRPTTTDEHGGPDQLGHLLERVYAAIAVVSGAEVVVDSSKLPTYAALIGSLPGIDLEVLHLVRDPRAAAHSWRRRKHQPDLGSVALMERRGAMKSAALWRVWNSALERWCQDQGIEHRLQNYESLVADPAGEMRRIVRRFQLAPPDRVDGVVDGVFAAPGLARVGTHHTVAGNPSRHEHGLVPLVPDDEWRAGLGPVDRRTVAVLTWPTLRHYGYRARV